MVKSVYIPKTPVHRELDGMAVAVCPPRAARLATTPKITSANRSPSSATLPPSGTDRAAMSVGVPVPSEPTSARARANLRTHAPMASSGMIIIYGVYAPREPAGMGINA